MPTSVRKFVRRRERPQNRDEATLRTLTILIPRRYNPDTQGARKPVELSKLVRTFREIRQLSPGYSLQRAEGWYRDRDTGKGIRDHHFRFEIDLFATPSIIAGLSGWKRTLERRLEQQSIYMALSKGVTWL
ncbi:MAG: hypothetical protein WCA10_10115 [Terracidiphilus sp.]